VYPADDLRNFRSLRIISLFLAGTCDVSVEIRIFMRNALKDPARLGIQSRNQKRTADFGVFCVESRQLARLRHFLQSLFRWDAYCSSRTLSFGASTLLCGLPRYLFDNQITFPESTLLLKRPSLISEILCSISEFRVRFSGSRLLLPFLRRVCMSKT
jgi:hypothetical protein